MSPCSCVSFSGLQQFINVGHRRRRAEPEHFLHHTMAPPFGSTPASTSVVSKMRFSHLFNLWMKSFSNYLPWALTFHRLCIFSLFRPHLMRRYFLVAAQCDVSQIPPFYPLKTDASSVLGWSSSQSRHSSTNQWKLAVSFLLSGAGPDLNPSRRCP